MAKDIDEKIGARSPKNWHGLKYKIPLKKFRVHKMPMGDCPRTIWQKVGVKNSILYKKTPLYREKEGRFSFSFACQLVIKQNPLWE